MLTVYENAVTEQEIAYLQQQFAELKSQVEFNDRYYLTDPTMVHELYNLDSKSLIQQERFDIRNEPVVEFVRAIVNRVLPKPLKPTVPIMFSRSVYPIGIHTDTDSNNADGHTIMIPLTFDERIKTLVWNETAIGPRQLDEIFQRFRDDIKSFRPQSKLSRQLDLRNCWLGYPSIVDFLSLDGIASWRAGSIFQFERQQLHASNNYREFVDSKDYVLIHNDE